MPIKSLLEPTLYVMDSNGNYTNLGAIKSATFIEDTPDVLDISGYGCFDSFSTPVVNPTIEATFEVIWNPTVDGVYLLIHGRLPSNNWKKMHRYPMKRKGKGRKKTGKMAHCKGGTHEENKGSHSCQEERH